MLVSRTVKVLAIKADDLGLNPQDPHGEKEEQTSHVVLWPLHVHPGAHACMRTCTYKLIVKQIMCSFINHHSQFFSPLLALGNAAFITAIETLRHEPKKLSCHSCLWSATEMSLGHLATGRHCPHPGCTQDNDVDSTQGPSKVTGMPASLHSPAAYHGARLSEDHQRYTQVPWRTSSKHLLLLRK